MNRSRKSSDDNAVVLKSKVKDLEDEVTKLKQRLEDLRKAKNNMIVKREREVIQVGQPNLGRPAGVETSKYKELEQRLENSESKRRDLEKKFMDSNDELLQAVKDKDSWNRKHDALQMLIEELNENHKLELEKIKSELREKAAIADDAEKEYQRLCEKLEIKSMQEEYEKKENNDREGYINGLIDENAKLREKVDSLFMDLSEKEARWLEAKDKMTHQIQQKWDEKYVKWMTETEEKIEDLRQQNLLLKSYLAKGSPYDDKQAGSSETSPDD